MNTTQTKRLVRATFCGALAALLILSVFGNTVHATPTPLTAQELLHYSGTGGFWSDPCTWDGFLTGAGAVLCGTGNLGGCVSFVVGIWKAIKVDNCF